MIGLPEFGYRWFMEAEETLKAFPGVEDVFNPAQHDLDTGFDLRGLKGTREEMTAQGFSRRMALAADWCWIGAKSDMMVAGPDWKDSPGTISEVACHQALGLPVYEYDMYVFHRRCLEEPKPIPSILGIEVS